MNDFQACLRAPFATLGISASDTHVTGIRFLAPDVPAKAPKKNTIAFLACVQIQSYLDDATFEFDLPLKLLSTRHRLEVWEAMQRIPAGATRSYGELAKELGSSARAVGGACGANPVPVLVPCHRVLAANKKLGGFSGGLDWKRSLLAREGIKF